MGESVARGQQSKKLSASSSWGTAREFFSLLKQLGVEKRRFQQLHSALLLACIALSSEGWTLGFIHRKRSQESQGGSRLTLGYEPWCLSCELLLIGGVGLAMEG